MSLTREMHCPEDVLAAIAWYPDGLDEGRRGAVEAHAADCVACREELAFVHGEPTPELPQADAQRVYARVLERIESYEREEGEDPAPMRTLVRAAEAPRRSWATSLVPVRAAAALVAAALVGGFVAYSATRSAAPADAVYHTVSDVTAAPVPGTASLALDVVFRPDATAERIQAALRAIGGEIVAGPTQLGVYRVRLAPTADTSAAATVLRGEGQGVATFAEPAPR